MNVSEKTYRLSKKQVEDFQENGHIFIENLAFKEEIDFFQPIINNACSQLSEEKRSLKDRDTYSKAFLQIMNLRTKNNAIKEFVFAKRFADVAAKSNIKLIS